MTFVIYSMGHILAPSTKHDVFVIDYWAAIANTDKIVDFNFSCWKVKQDIQNNRPVTHLTGCHLFFQIFYLDNLDLGMLNLPHSSYPRISCFDESRVRKMIIQCTGIGPGPTDFCTPVYDVDDEVTPKQPKLPAQLDPSKNWADSIIGGIIMFNDEADPPEDAVLFAQISPFKPTPSSTVHTSYADSHWTDGRSHIDPPPSVLVDIDSYIRNTPSTDITSPWITHPDPRYCSLTGDSIVEQLSGTKLLDHEACCLIFRCFNQIDNQLLYPGSTPKWRVFIEPDFSTSVLAGDNVWDMVSIQKQFTAPNIINNIPNTRLFIIPAYLPSGWTVYCWDMKRKIIHMCDPMADASSYTAQKASHFLSATLFARNESGVCMLHTARHFNGIGLACKPANETLAHQKKLMAAELLQLHGNLAILPAPLKAIFHAQHNA
ncbi:hypothetical protein TRIUR3_15206 [Triticum urartu]|uniref:Uncharacterized protein n=1 Tax=Triticum urartu TaxID=4572 RepID=M7ZGQ1_TRIUA|nr:hypothetical protein TRIUR3_15206 [Triticum urartu]